MEAVTKAVTDALIELNLSKIMERLDKQVSMLTDRVVALEIRQPTNEDRNDSSTGGQLPKDVVYDANGNVDEAATRQARLQCRLRTNMTSMGGAQSHNHHHQGNNNRVPNDPYAKIKFTIPSFSGLYDAEGYLDWMTIE